MKRGLILFLLVTMMGCTMNQKSPPQGGTEPPFQNAYWDNKKPGIYVDVVTGKPLFSSLDKYDSGTGWPSFTKPIDETNIVSKEDHSYGMSRTEIKSKDGTHLGHVFDDGPGPSGQRFCVNSASLRFIPVEKLEAEGYGQYLALFQKDKVVKPASTEKAIMAGGCFWGVEEILRKIPGVTTVVVGYTGGEMKNPKYEDVTTGRTGHAEAVEVFFDSSKLSYEELLGYFFRLHDPTTLNRQENDTGTQYRSSIFYLNEAQKKTAEKVKAQVEKSGKWKSSIVTQIVPAQQFWTAEEYHQDYLQKNPNGYMCHWLRD